MPKQASSYAAPASPRQRRRSAAAATPASDPMDVPPAAMSPPRRRSARLAVNKQADALDTRPLSPSRTSRSKTPNRTRGSVSARPSDTTPHAATVASPPAGPQAAAGPRTVPLVTGEAASASDLVSSQALSPRVAPREAAALAFAPRRHRRGLAARSWSSLKIAWEHALRYEDIPDWMRDNCLIRTNYRPQMALKYAMLSLFSLHNETFNTWSHLAGAFIMIWRMVMFQQLPPPPSPALLEGATHPHPPKWPLYLFLAVNCYVYLASASAHLLHVVSKRFNDILWRLDHTAIAISCTVAFVPICIYALECRMGLAELYCSVTCILAAAVMVVSSLEFFHLPKFRALRAAVQLSFPIWAQVPLFHMTSVLRPHPEAFTSLLGVYQAIGIMVVGAGIFATRVTERLLPVGSVDLIGSSHNIMHVMVVISHLVFMEAGQGLWLWRGSADGMCPARHH